VTRFIWTFARQSYNYLLHKLAPLKPKTLSSLSCILLINSVSCGVLSLAVSQHLFSSVIPCSVLLSCTGSPVLYWPCTVPPFLADESLLCSVLYCLLANEFSLVVQSPSNPLQVALGVPSREHLFEQFIFLAVSKRLSRCCGNKSFPTRWLAMNVYS
jgi:predicted neutral ceramidase superfamily lipid hydrolase